MNNSGIRFIFILMVVVMTGCNKTNLKAGFSGKDLTSQAEIVIDKTTKLPILNISYSGNWRLYVGTSVGSIDFSAPIIEGDEPGKYGLPVNEQVRHYYQLETMDGNAILAERHLPMAGGYNFRDMGGLKNKEGKYTKWGKVFRSDELKELTKEDIVYLNSIPLLSIVDFRSGKEIEDSPDIIPDSVRSEYIFSITPGNLSGLSVEDISSITREQSIEIMEAINRQFVTDPACIEQYRLFFSLLQNEQNIPLMYHCTAGKDRTGMASYLFLASLGVDEQDILNDYLLSNRYLQDKYGNYMRNYPSLAPLLEVMQEYLKAGIDAIRESHGNVEDFLVEQLEVDLNKMKEIYLY